MWRDLRKARAVKEGTDASADRAAHVIRAGVKQSICGDCVLRRVKWCRRIKELLLSSNYIPLKQLRRCYVMLCYAMLGGWWLHALIVCSCCMCLYALPCTMLLLKTVMLRRVWLWIDYIKLFVMCLINYRGFLHTACLIS